MEKLRINNLAELRDWLEINYELKESVWLVFPKKSTGVDFAWSEIVDVLLCYGWIDSLPRKVDDEYTSIRISPRNPKSNWSMINKQKVAVLEEKGLIHPNGRKVIELAKYNGTWNALDEVENLILPADLEGYLVQNGLLAAWNEKSKSFRKGFLQGLIALKKAETRTKKLQTLTHTLK